MSGFVSQHAMVDRSGTSTPVNCGAPVQRTQGQGARESTGACRRIMTTSDFVAPKGQEAKQDLIAMRGKFVRGSRLSLFMHASNEGCANLRG
jgi:hypothetical protein